MIDRIRHFQETHHPALPYYGLAVVFLEVLAFIANHGNI